MTAHSQSPDYLAHRTVDDRQIEEWIDTFYKQGFLFLESVLPPE